MHYAILSERVFKDPDALAALHDKLGAYVPVPMSESFEELIAQLRERQADELFDVDSDPYRKIGQELFLGALAPDVDVDAMASQLRYLCIGRNDWEHPPTREFILFCVDRWFEDLGIRKRIDTLCWDWEDRKWI